MGFSPEYPTCSQAARFTTVKTGSKDLVRVLVTQKEVGGLDVPMHILVLVDVLQDIQLWRMNTQGVSAVPNTASRGLRSSGNQPLLYSKEHSSHTILKLSCKTVFRENLLAFASYIF